MTNNKKILIYALMALILPTLTSELLAALFSFEFSSPILGILLIAGIIVAVIVGVELCLYFAPRLKGTSVTTVAQKITESSLPYRLAGGAPFYTADERFLHELTKRDANKKRPLASYSLFFVVMVREYFSWIDFVNLSFLAKLSKRTGIEATVILEGDENAMDSSIHRARSAARFRAEEEKYKRIISSIFGGNVTIRSALYYRHSDAKKYAYEFHTLYVKRFLGYIKQLESGEITYSMLKHKLSYLESVFPVISTADKTRRRETVLILDRENSKSTWSESPLREKIEDAGVYFINAGTIPIPKDEGAAVLSLDLLAPHVKIREQLEGIDDEVKCVMRELLRAAIDADDEYGGSMDEEIAILIREIKAKYGIRGNL